MNERRMRGGAERKTADLCNRILREYDSRISSWCLFTYKVRNVTVFFIGAVVEVLRSEETLNDTTKKLQERVCDRYRTVTTGKLLSVVIAINKDAA